MNRKKWLIGGIVALVAALTIAIAVGTCDCDGDKPDNSSQSSSFEQSSEDVSSSLDDSSVLGDGSVLDDLSSESGVIVDGDSSEEISASDDDSSYNETSTSDENNASSDDGDGTSAPDESSSNDEVSSSMLDEDSSNGEENAPDEDFSSEEISTPDEDPSSDEESSFVGSSSEEHTHVWGKWSETEKATCTKEGEERRDCENCDEYETRKIEILAHTYSELKYDDIQHWYECSCGDVKSGSLENHYGGTATTTEKAKCTLCEQAYGELLTPEPVLPGPEKYEKLADGTINFGAYPQSKVTDETLATALTEKAGVLPTESDGQNWTSYKYYIGGSNATDYMWYQDVAYGDNIYRGVYFTSYRSYLTSGGITFQDDNGYNTNTVYWFEWETLNWTVLAENDGKAFLLCNSIIDSQEYYHSKDSRTINEITVYANNYAESNIRKWLNETFYQTAFTSLQQSLIETAFVDNSAESANPCGQSTDWNDGINQYSCENTSDKIFLLSIEEITNPSYGFNSDPDHYEVNSARLRKTSDYAQVQGCYTVTDKENPNYGNGAWWLRSPHYDDSISVLAVGYSDPIRSQGTVHYTGGGVVPALKITL